jgi:hypothetical protein
MEWVWKFKQGKMNKDESGYILVMSLFVLVILFLIGTTLAIMGIQEFTLSARTKLMDQAYSIADAGVNRAAVALQVNSNLTTQYSPAYPTPQSGPSTESFGGGSFTYSIYQTDDASHLTDPTYKIIRSTGTISKAGKTAERTIETRIIVGAGGDEYDASFDYLFYVGNSDWTNASPSQVPPVWPDTTRLGSFAIAGDYTYDGYTQDPGLHSPKGAMYVKGSINVPVTLLGNVVFQGNVVATDDVNMKDTWAVGWSSPGLKIGGNGKIIAGIDPTHGGNGDITVDQSYSTTVGNPTMQIDGLLCAARDVKVDATLNASFTDPVLRINGIKAGRDVTFTGTANLISEALTIGTIVAGRTVTINSNWLNVAGVTANNIYAGQNAGGDGVVLSTKFASKITTGSIISRGRVSANATLAGVTLGSVTAGNSNAGSDYGGTGIYFNMGASGCSAGNLTSQGLVDMNASWLGNISSGNIWAGTDSGSGSGGTGVQFRGSALSSVSCGTITSVGSVVDNASSGSSWGSSWIWSGNYVNLNAGELWIADDTISTGAISAVGYVNVKSGDDVTVGNVVSNAWVKVYSSDAVTTGGISAKSLGGALGPDGYSVYVKSYAWGGIAGNHVQTSGTIYADGPIYWYSTAEGFGSDSHLTGGAWGSTVHIERALGVDVWDTTDAKIGTIPSTGDSVRACGNFYSQCPGWIGDAFDNDIDISSTVRQWSGYSYDVEDTDVPSHVWDNGIALPTITSVNSPSLPGKPNPVYVDNNGIFEEPGPSGQIKNVDPLAEAGLKAPVNLIAPNWSYFSSLASHDDAINPAAPHMIYDGGAGDSDGVTNGVIRFVWDASKPYSTQETIYNGDSGVRVEIQTLKWNGKAATFVATLVSQGDVTITATNTDWFMDSGNTLNIVSGHNITNTTAGMTLWDSNSSQLHMYATHNIDMTNMRFSISGTTLYYGSFTAGNRIYMADNSFYPNTTFRWSRWSLNSMAWAPPFKVLTWREI